MPTLFSYTHNLPNWLWSWQLPVKKPQQDPLEFPLNVDWILLKADVLSAEGKYDEGKKHNGKKNICTRAEKMQHFVSASHCNKMGSTQQNDQVFQSCNTYAVCFEQSTLKMVVKDSVSGPIKCANWHLCRWTRMHWTQDSRSFVLTTQPFQEHWSFNHFPQIPKGSTFTKRQNIDAKAF